MTAFFYAIRGTLLSLALGVAVVVFVRHLKRQWDKGTGV